MTCIVFLITAGSHIAVRDTRGRAMLLLTKIWDPQLGNPRGTLLKQADQKVPGPTGQKCGQYLGKMWAEAGTHMWNPHSTWDPYETGGQKLYGAHMGGTVGKICGNCVQDLGPIWATHMGTI